MGVLKNRNFSILLSGQLISQLGNSLFLLALPWYVYVSSGSKGALVLTGFVLALPGIAGLFSGVFVDRWNKRATMIISDVLRCVLSAFIAWFAWHGHGHLVLLVVILVLIMQFVGTFFSPAEGTLLPIVVGEEQLASANGINQSSSAVVQLAGSFGGGALLSLLGAPVLFIYNAASFLISIISLGFLRITETINRSDNQSPSFMRELGDGWRFIISSKLVQSLIVAGLIANFALAAVDIGMTAWVKGPMHGSAFSFGVINGIFFVGVMLGGVFLARLTKVVHIKAIVQYGLILAGVGTCLTGAWANLYWNSAVWFVSGIVISLMNSSLSTYVMQIVPTELRGRVFGTWGALNVMAAPLGIALFGVLMLHVRLSVLFTVMGVLCVIGGLILFLPSVRRETVTPAV